MRTGLKWSDFKHVLTGVDVVPETVDVKEIGSGTPQGRYRLTFDGNTAISMLDLSSLVELAGGSNALLLYWPGTGEHDSNFEMWVYA